MVVKHEVQVQIARSFPQDSLHFTFYWSLFLAEMSRFRAAFKSASKTSAYLLPATSLAALAYNSFQPNTLDSASTFFNGVVRSSRAVFTITSCAVDYKYSLHGLPSGSDEYGLALSEVHLRSARRILELCDANKGFYVKAGQFVAAMRQVPREYSSILSSLHDQAVPCNFEAIKEVIIRSLGKDLSEIFLSFDEQPVAAASIAQVHHAFLKDHQEVAVKVQYPGLDYQMKFDLSTMAILSRSVSWFFPEYRFEWLISEFTKSISAELDFILEAKNSETAAKNFRKNKRVRIPCVYWDFTSSQVLTMEFCEGQKVNDLEFLDQMGISPLEVARSLVDVFAEMIFVHGFLHGDPHPGNILVCPVKPSSFSLVILDHGIYKQLSEDFRKNYCLLWEALVMLDSHKIQQLGETFGVGKYARYFPVIFTGRTIDSKSMLRRGMSLEEKQHLKEELKSLKMEDISSFMESLPPDFLTVLRTDGLLRSLISKLSAPQHIRLLSYAKFALRGLFVEASNESDSVELLLSKFRMRIRYVQLKVLLDMMEWIAYMNDLRRGLTNTLRQLIVSTRNQILSFILINRLK